MRELNAQKLEQQHIQEIQKQDFRQPEKSTEQTAEQKRLFAHYLPDELVKTYLQHTDLLKNPNKIRAMVVNGDDCRNDREKMQEIDERIAILKRGNQNTVEQYRAEQNRRENRFFGLGSLVSKKENDEQQRLQQVYGARNREIKEKIKEKEMIREKYDSRIETETDQLKKMSQWVVTQISQEIAYRPESEFKGAYDNALTHINNERQPHSITSKAIENVEKCAENARKSGDVVAERIAYLNGANVLKTAEKQADKAIHEQNKPHSRDFDMER